LTGTGLKDPDTAIKQCVAAHPVTIDASLDAVNSDFGLFVMGGLGLEDIGTSTKPFIDV
jgi:hypothetical protein